MQKLGKGILIILFSMLSSYHAYSQDSLPLPQAAFTQISSALREEVDSGHLPGAVVLVGNQEGVIFLESYGNRALIPEKLPMTEDTIFDIASLTKPIATTTAIMQLEEEGKLNLDDPVCKYWPEFSRNGKDKITIRHLLTHYSGLRADLDMDNPWSGYRTAMQMIADEKMKAVPGTQFEYSDINFAILGELVRRISGEPLDQYCKNHIFIPLGMKDSGFLPEESLRPRIAPTEFRPDGLIQGVVHDPMAHRMGGVSGHAGMFSTALDLAHFCRMILNQGSLNGMQILKPETIARIRTPQPSGKKIQRGLGWDFNSPIAERQGLNLFHPGTFGHTGFTGTSIWIDPDSNIFVIVLANHIHPFGKGDIKPLRLKVASIVSSALKRP